MNIKFRADWLGLITLILIMLKLFVHGFMLSWLWVLSPLWAVCGFICALGLLDSVVKTGKR